MTKSTRLVRQAFVAVAVTVVFGFGLTGCAAGATPSSSSPDRAFQTGETRNAPRESPTTDAAEAEPVTGDQITAVGDSVMVASQQGLEQIFPGIDIHAEVSSQLASAAEEIHQLEERGVLRDVVVIGLGINGVGGEEDAASAIDAADGRRVVFVTAHGPNQYVEGVNAGIRAAVSHSSNAVVAEWDDVISQRPDLLARDGIHPGEAGGLVYAETIRDALTARTQ